MCFLIIQADWPVSNTETCDSFYSILEFIDTERRTSPMDHINRMQLFARVVETGSFSSAGKAEGVAQSTVSKEISALEKRLGAQLIRRSARGLSVTEQGRYFYDFALGMLADLDAAETWIRTGDTAPRGRIRVAAPAVLSSRFIAPHLPELLLKHPELSIDMEVSERYVSLVEDGIDVAVRIGVLKDSSLIARRIGSLEPVVVGAPSYLAARGVPRSPTDLETHVCLPFLFQGGSKTWKFRSPQGNINISPSSRLRTNDAESVHAIARAGLGLAQGPRWMFAQDLEQGTLVAVLEEYRADLVPIHAIASGSRRMTGAIKVLVDFIAQKMDGMPHLRVGGR
ncbi:LysR family transcriptional regulator [Pseudomonas sp. SDO5222_S391]